MTYTSTAGLSPGARVDAALALRGDGRLEDALRLLSQAAEYSTDVCTLRGDLLFELGLLHDALSNYSAVLAFVGDNAYVQHQLALCLRRLERWEEAVAAFRKLLARDPHNDNAQIALGECLLRLERPAEALVCFDACQADAAQATGLFGKAVALQLQRRFEEAEWAYQRHLVHEPNSTEAYANLIALSVELFDLERVQRYSLRLLALRPHSRVALQGLTLAALERGQYDVASRYYARLESPGEDVHLGGTVQYQVRPEASGRMNRLRQELAERPPMQPAQTPGTD